ncbi:hypothetical protein HMPREF9005_1186 [Actinomyces sp. oral taxon 178 str. F0338]|nr:hypothetical protein HMPREF9005_1186 [Actinomyces sp. oral taxon 178 str. F0338]
MSWLSGSSPRVRGKRRLLPTAARPGGLIPARAGKTSPAKTVPAGTAAHPRACGENRFDTDPLLHDDGSSPRVRGKPLAPVFDVAEARLIPARAGKTRRRCPVRA